MPKPEHTWDNLREIMELVSPDSTPLVKHIEFHYELLEQQDGGGTVVETITMLRGATIEVGMH